MLLLSAAETSGRISYPIPRADLQVVTSAQGDRDAAASVVSKSDLDRKCEKQSDARKAGAATTLTPALLFLKFVRFSLRRGMAKQTDIG